MKNSSQVAEALSWDVPKQGVDVYPARLSPEKLHQASWLEGKKAREQRLKDLESRRCEEGIVEFGKVEKDVAEREELLKGISR